MVDFNELRAKRRAERKALVHDMLKAIKSPEPIPYEPVTFDDDDEITPSAMRVAKQTPFAAEYIEETWTRLENFFNQDIDEDKMIRFCRVAVRAGTTLQETATYYIDTRPEGFAAI